MYGTRGTRYVLWLIVLLSLTYFQFTAAAGHSASRSSIVCDERRFHVAPRSAAARTGDTPCLLYKDKFVMDLFNRRLSAVWLIESKN